MKIRTVGHFESSDINPWVFIICLLTVLIVDGMFLTLIFTDFNSKVKKTNPPTGVRAQRTLTDMRKGDKFQGRSKCAV